MGKHLDSSSNDIQSKKKALRRGEKKYIRRYVVIKTVNKF